MEGEALEQSLTTTLDKLKSVVETQGISASIDSFMGEEKRYSEWIKQIEKYAILANLESKRMKLVAYQTSRGPVSEYIRRRLTSPTYRDETWDELKANLASRFAYITDPHVAFMLLRQAKQQKGETVVVFSERLIELADSSFVGQTVNSDYIEKQLIGIFIDGLLQDGLKYKLMKANPTTLSDAITLANNEESLRKRFDLRTGRRPDLWPNREGAPRAESGRYEEGMEVDHIRPNRRCPRCREFHPRSRPCRIRTVNEVSRLAEGQKRTVACWTCGGPHYRSECNLEKDRFPGGLSGGTNERPNNKKMLCFNCGSPQHRVANCDKLPPTRVGNVSGN